MSPTISYPMSAFAKPWNYVCGFSHVDCFLEHSLVKATGLCPVLHTGVQVQTPMAALSTLLSLRAQPLWPVLPSWPWWCWWGVQSGELRIQLGLRCNTCQKFKLWWTLFSDLWWWTGTILSGETLQRLCSRAWTSASSIGLKSDSVALLNYEVWD
jgi:hypothetical protein